VHPWWSGNGGRGEGLQASVGVGGGPFEALRGNHGSERLRLLERDSHVSNRATTSGISCRPTAPRKVTPAPGAASSQLRLQSKRTYTSRDTLRAAARNVTSKRCGSRHENGRSAPKGCDKIPDAHQRRSRHPQSAWATILHFGRGDPRPYPLHFPVSCPYPSSTVSYFTRR
jgi:hypothetical protein